LQPHRKDRSSDDVTRQRVEGGFPHSEIFGSKLVRSSPKLIAAYHVLHRLSAPRHPPDALTTLDYSHDRCPLGVTGPRSKKDLSSIFQPKTYFACQAYPTPTAAGRGWFIGTRSPDWSNMPPLYDVKHPRSRSGEANLCDGRIQRSKGSKGSWWSLSGSNRRPEACKATALPAELRPRSLTPAQAPRGPPSPWLSAPRGAAASRPCLSLAGFGPKLAPIMVGLGRLERPTSPLSGVRSNHLSYRPEPHPRLPQSVDPGSPIMYPA
jgi:hypothetical protein